MMLRTILTLAALVTVIGAGVPAVAGECKGCDKIASGEDGFCCGKGRAYGIQLASEKLYQALSGFQYKIADIKCPECKTAAESSGKCSHCNLGAANGKFYKSPIAYSLAKGKPVSAEKAAYCGGCKTAHKEHGRCTACDVGFVAGRKFKDKGDYEAALAAHETLAKAAEASSKCETCAVAMVLDGKCEHCKASFKNGKKVG